MVDIKTYQKTLNVWGEQAQYDQMIEECAELITALKHYQRGRIGKEALISELADVTLMVGQLTWMFGETEVEQAVEEKLQKLHQLLEKDQRS
ncbi:MAG: antitoxin [Desulfuromonas sp.]|nr:MAG: antitoxin [Desulfuromonas sp.]